MDTIKFGNVEFDVSSFPYKTKRDFMNAYADEKVFKFDREKAWNHLKQYVPKRKYE